MVASLIQQLADFSSNTTFEDLPDVVVDECKRILLDSIGCALASIDQPKGRIGVQYGRLLGGCGGDATIIGTELEAIGSVADLTKLVGSPQPQL